VLPKFVDPPSRQARIPKTLPVYIFNGSRDPVSDNIGQLLDAYRTAGLTQVVHTADTKASTRQIATL
jgi:alpha-beta hydrolase superfamily lysophospholipase